MYAQEPLVLELTALLKAHGVRDIVISPGSRHYAFTRTLRERPRLPAAFGGRRAVGGVLRARAHPGDGRAGRDDLHLRHRRAQLRIGPRRSRGTEAPPGGDHDRPAPRVPRSDGRPDDRSAGLFDRFVRYAGNLRPISNERDRWYCNRVINEALVAAREDGGGPVHLNVPIESHSGVQFTLPQLPEVRVIARHRARASTSRDWSAFADAPRAASASSSSGGRDRARASAPSPHSPPSPSRSMRPSSPTTSPTCTSRTASTTRWRSSGSLRRPDPALKPDVVITFGGNVVFKDELKGFVQRVRSRALAGRSRTGRSQIPSAPSRMSSSADPSTSSSASSRRTRADRPIGSYARRMLQAAESIPAPSSEHGELSADRRVSCSALPDGSALHIANSAPIRMAQLHAIDRFDRSLLQPRCERNRRLPVDRDRLRDGHREADVRDHRRPHVLLRHEFALDPRRSRQSAHPPAEQRGRCGDARAAAVRTTRLSPVVMSAPNTA